MRHLPGLRSYPQKTHHWSSKGYSIRGTPSQQLLCGWHRFGPQPTAAIACFSHRSVPQYAVSRGDSAGELSCVCPQSQQSDNRALTSVSTVTPVLGFNGQHHSARQHPSFVRALEWGKTLDQTPIQLFRIPVSTHPPSKPTSGGPQGFHRSMVSLRARLLCFRLVSPSHNNHLLPGSKIPQLGLCSSLLRWTNTTVCGLLPFLGFITSTFLSRSKVQPLHIGTYGQSVNPASILLWGTSH